jgi:NitT/TauT family transport system substrate-binding protein
VASDWAGFVKLVKESPRPLRIGYKDPMANAFLIFTRALAEEGIRFGQEPATADGIPVQIITMNLQGDENTLPSMEAGLVDGVVANEPMPSLLVHRKVGRRVADLSLLPPAGKWKDHPCCVVAANEHSLREKRHMVTSLLKVIAAGSDILMRDRAKGLAAETRWTKTPPAVGEESIVHVSYVARADKTWLASVDTWSEMMISSKTFQKNLKGKSPADIRSISFDLGPLNQALSELSLRSGRTGKN